MIELLVNLQRWKSQRQWQILLKKNKDEQEILDVTALQVIFTDLSRKELNKI